MKTVRGGTLICAYLAEVGGVYLCERPRWPSLTWEERNLSNLLAGVSREQGRLLGRMEALGFDLRDEAHLQRNR